MLPIGCTFFASSELVEGCSNYYGTSSNARGETSPCCTLFVQFLLQIFRDESCTGFRWRPGVLIIGRIAIFPPGGGRIRATIARPWETSGPRRFPRQRKIYRRPLNCEITIGAVILKNRAVRGGRIAATGMQSICGDYLFRYTSSRHLIYRTPGGSSMKPPSSSTSSSYRSVF